MLLFAVVVVVVCCCSKCSFSSKVAAHLLGYLSKWAQTRSLQCALSLLLFFLFENLCLLCVFFSFLFVFLGICITIIINQVIINNNNNQKIYSAVTSAAGGGC